MLIILFIVKTDKYMEFQVNVDSRWYDVAEHLVEIKLIQNMNNIGIYKEAIDYYTENLYELVRSKYQELDNLNIFQILEGCLRNKCISEIYEDKICMVIPTPKVLTISLTGQIKEEIEVSSSMLITDLIKQIENTYHISNFSLNLLRNGREIDMSLKLFENQTLEFFQLEYGETLIISKQQLQSDQQSDQQPLPLQQFQQLPQYPYYEQEIQDSQFVETQLSIYIHDGIYVKVLNLRCCLVNTTIQDLMDAVESYLNLQKAYAIPAIYINDKVQSNSSSLHELKIDQNTKIQAKVQYSGGCTIQDNQGNNQQSEFMNFIYSVLESEDIRGIFNKQVNIVGDLLTIII